MQIWHCLEQRYTISSRALAFVQAPCLIIQPDSSLVFSHTLGEELQKELINAHCELHVVDGQSLIFDVESI